MTHSLPRLANIEAFRAWRADASQCLPAALDIARSHGLPHGDPELFSTGTNLVVALDDRRILKIFPPLLRDQFVSERLSLSQLRGRLRLPIPEIVIEGERDQWPYLVITRLRGIVGSEVWPALPEDEKERVLRHLGETIAEVQRVPPGDLSGVGLPWADFISRQIELLSRDGGHWQLAGLFDFGDVMTGWKEYDLLGPSAFMTAGLPRRVASLFRGFGYSQGDIDSTLKRRLMALLLLHRASDPVRHICIEGWQEKARDLFELQDLLWPV